MTALTLVVLLSASLVLGLRYWLLPNISDYREVIVSRVSQEIGQPVSVQSIEAGWDGLHPHLVLENVVILDRDGQAALSFEHLEGTLSWTSIALGGIRLRSLVIEQPELKIRRLSSGEIYIGGILANSQNEQPGFADWLVRQKRIEVRNATVSWQDDLRGLPVLELKKAGLLMRNRGSRHQLGLRAELPKMSAYPIDFRADFKSDSLRDAPGWSGRFYARADMADFARWKPWVEFDVPVETGRGGVRAWGDFSKGSLSGLIVDVDLFDLSGKLAADLPTLRLDHLAGRLDWRRRGQQQSFEVIRLGAMLHGRPAITPVTARLKLDSSRPAEYDAGDFKLDAISLSSLREISAFLPLDRDWADKIERLSPKGSLSKLRMSWKGAWPNPEIFEFKSDFKGLGIRPMKLTAGALSPGFSGLSGHVGLDQSGGAIILDSHLVALEFPGIFEQPIGLDALNTQLEWRIDRQDKQPHFKLTRAEFSNQHLAGSASGAYQASAQGAGIIDLNAKLTRADARFIRDYLPLVIGNDVRDWVGNSITAGSSRDVRLRLKGGLNDFPFEDGKSGIFEVRVKGSDAVLKYAPDWPAISGIGVDLLFKGKGLEIWANSGRTFDMKIGKVHAWIPDMDRSDVTLELEGDASGPADSMLRFIEQSPVREKTAGFSAGVQGTGEGRLKLSLKLPLDNLDRSRVAGNYLLQNVSLTQGAFPPLERLNGILSFTDSSVSSPGIRGQFLDGPVVIGAKTEKDRVAINIAGKINAAGIRKVMPNKPALSRLSGEANWNGKVAVTRETMDVQFSSNLQGLRSDLPTPFNKRAADSIPLQFERKANGGGGEMLTVSYGTVAKLQLDRRLAGGSIARGVLHFGADALKLPPSGFWVTGALPYLDVDHWRSLMSEAAQPDEGMGVDGIALQCATMDVFGKRLHGLRINGAHRDGVWQGVIESKEISGKLTWNPHEAGHLTGRFSSLAIPDAAPPKLTAPDPQPDPQPVSSRWPALDITAEAFSMKSLHLGKLVLKAQPIGQDWRIESLKLNTEESSLSLLGMWQDWLINPRSQVNVEFETRDIGKFLARIGYPDSVSAGQAKMKAQLAWAGSPANIDYPSLSGVLNLDARKGQFLKVDPGIGKLLGVLSLQSLPRRITLDFKDVFSDGFAFDELSGTVKITQGIARSSDFKMGGPAAKISMKGETDLVRETQNLNVRVVPVFGDTVAGAATLLGGPVVGLTTYVIQKALQDPIGQLVSYEYGVTGSWDNPAVEKLKRQSVENPSWDEISN